jgi:hypothetical protein
MSPRLWLLVILVGVGAFAPSRADARGAETCARGFLATATTARPESEPQVAGLHQGFPACGYESASGYSQAAETEEAAPLMQQLEQRQMAGPSLRMTPDQQALKELVDEATLGARQPLTVDQAQTVLDWADEVGYPGVRAGPGDVSVPSNWTANPVPHIHFPGVGSGHIPIDPGLPPWNP